MNKMIRVKMGKASQAAVEIAIDGMLGCDDCEPHELAVGRVFTGEELRFMPEEKELIVRGLIEICNSEDAQVEEPGALDEQGKKRARAAIRALQTLIERVNKSC